MCVDYRMLNQLLPKVDKAHSKAKGVLTLVPLPKIDEIYAKLEGSTIYSTFDMRSGYYHLELNEESQPKSAFVVGGPKGGKWEFIPKYSDIARPLTNLTRKDIPFEWSKACQAAFEMLKEYLLKEPILKYPKPDQPYILYTDASKYAWAGVLTQAYVYKEEGKEYSIHHPITYVSGLFKGPQLNWAALTKEAYAIYMVA